MNEKFQHILKLALHPTTGDGEAAAALNAARRMVSKQGMDQLWNVNPVVQEKIIYKDKIVYKDRVVYRGAPNFDPYSENSLDGDLTISATRLHACLEKMFGLAKKRNIVLFVKSVTTSDKTISGASKIKWAIYGPPDQLRAWYAEVHHLINGFGQADKKSQTHKPQANNPQQPSTSSEKEPKRGFFAKLFGWK